MGYSRVKPTWITPRPQTGAEFFVRRKSAGKKTQIPESHIQNQHCDKTVCSVVFRFSNCGRRLQSGEHPAYSSVEGTSLYCMFLTGLRKKTSGDCRSVIFTDENSDVSNLLRGPCVCPPRRPHSEMLWKITKTIITKNTDKSIFKKSLSLNKRGWTVWHYNLKSGEWCHFSKILNTPLPFT